MNKDNDFNDNNLEFFIQDTEDLCNANIHMDFGENVCNIDMHMECDETASVSNLSTDGFFYGNNNMISSNFEDDYNALFKLPYYRKKAMYGDNDTLYYENEYTVKDLIKICEYYKIDKQVKSEKNKKVGIISAIIFFESLAENQHIVIKRHQMWAYIDALSKDENMRKYIIWN